MDFREASELQKKWGDKPCDHPDLEQEDPISGQWSGDWVCTRCGAMGPRKDLEKDRRAQTDTNGEVG